MQIFSFSPFGYKGSIVRVEADKRKGIPSVDIVGLADGAVKEARERMRCAIGNSGFDFPAERLLLTLSPADLKKEGAMFDLAMAMSVLHDENWIKEDVLVLGELELSGRIRPVRACYAAGTAAKASGIEYAICSKVNADELKGTGLKVLAIEDLKDAVEKCNDISNYVSTEAKAPNDDVQFIDVEEGIDFDVFRKHPKAARAMIIAAAGKHNILFAGAPGCGKTAMLQRLPYITPLNTLEEAQSVTRIHSLAGLMKPNEPYKMIPPFRMPHQTASIGGMCGGGPNCRPGEISLAHNGILFLDEAAEFRTSVLQMLRVPLESHSITLCRAGRSTVYPANFQLALATNPCPCGNFGNDKKICLCSFRSIEMYWKKFSAPLIDRIEIKHYMTEEDEEKTFSLEEARKQIKTAIETQRKRGVYNSRMTPQQILEYVERDGIEEAAFDEICGDMSNRNKSNVLKLARTIADMEARNVEYEDIVEAVGLVAMPDFLTGYNL